MAKERNLKTAVISALIGSIFGTTACLIFYYGFSQPGAALLEAQRAPTVNATPTSSPAAIMPNPEIKASDVTSVSINTSYIGYFEAGSQCAKTYNEYFGNDDGFGSSSSPCTAEITIGRDGKATRSITIERWDKTSKAKKVVERSVTTADITIEQFGAIVQTIVANEAFRSWKDGMMVNVRNTTITAVYAGGTRSPMSNVDEKTTVFLEMVRAFKQLEKQLSWKSA